MTVGPATNAAFFSLGGEMPILQVNLDDETDVKAGIAILLSRRSPGAVYLQGTPADGQRTLAQAVAVMKTKKIWKFLLRVAGLDDPEYSLPELGKHLGLTTNKVCSLKAILAKPEQRLGVQFFELAPASAVDPAGNPRYRMPEAIRQAITDA
jgi:hypothetical protein